MWIFSTCAANPECDHCMIGTCSQVSLTLHHSFDVKNYPFDTHTLSIELQSFYSVGQARSAPRSVALALTVATVGQPYSVGWREQVADRRPGHARRMGTTRLSLLR